MFFVFPQAWITPAIAAAALAFGPVDGEVHIKYRALPPGTLGEIQKPNKILIDKRPRSQWPKAKAQCVIVHEYGHLKNRPHSTNPQSIMYPVLRPKPCYRWLRRHHVN